MEQISPSIALTILVALYILPLAHVIFSSKAGPWKLADNNRCPFSPRIGWIVIILFIGVFGWLMFYFSSRKKQKFKS